MSVTDLILGVYRVDKQILGLRGRLNSAEGFLKEQTRQRDALVAQIQTLDNDAKRQRAKAGELESQIKSIDERIAKLRSTMDTSQTNREYKALLTEVNTLKAERDRIESEALDFMGKSEEQAKQSQAYREKLAQQEKLRDVASSDRDARHTEIKDKLEQLVAERSKLALEVPNGELAMYEQLFRHREEDAMASIQEIDRKRHEYACGACMMALPFDAVNRLVARGSVTTCTSCGVLLYVEREMVEIVRR